MNATHTITAGFCTVCGETEEWIVASSDKYVYTDQITTKTANDLVPGDTIHYDSQNVWKITAKVSETPKMVTLRFEYIRADYDPSRVGTSVNHRFRKSTVFQMA